MNYRKRAYFLGSFFIATGLLVLIYLIREADSFPLSQGVPVEGSLIVFTGLGLLLIGTLTLFAAPETLVPSEIVSGALTPSTANQALIMDSLLTDDIAFHVPKVILGGEPTVFLLLAKESMLSNVEDSPLSENQPIWSRTRKVLRPTGIDMMKGYEKILKRDFLEIDTQQLARLLGRAIVSELQLASGFTLRESSSSMLEAVWVNSTIRHTCLDGEGRGHPELCCLCSSVACSLAKASGKIVVIDGANFAEVSSTVTVTYRMLSH